MGVSPDINTWFEIGRITMMQSLGLLYSWLHNMTGHNAADEREMNIKTAYDYGFCREVHISAVSPKHRYCVPRIWQTRFKTSCLQ